MSGPEEPRHEAKGLGNTVTTLGLVCVVVLAVAGLAVVGFFVLSAVAMSRFGSNK
jgi:hypothetical protein